MGRKKKLELDRDVLRQSLIMAMQTHYNAYKKNVIKAIDSISIGNDGRFIFLNGQEKYRREAEIALDLFMQTKHRLEKFNTLNTAEDIWNFINGEHSDEKEL